MQTPSTPTTPNHSERTHAKHSPSSLKHKELCARWKNKDQKSIYAEEGEAAHEAVEAYLRGDSSLLAAMPEDMRLSAQMVIDYVEPRIMGYTIWRLEERIFVADPFLRELTHGTPDLVVMDGPNCAVFDYKFGRRPVDHASKNLQGFAYMLAVFDTYPEIQTIRMAFAAPRVVDGFTDAEFTREKDYDRIYTRVYRVVARAEDELIAPCASWEACAYCANKANCVALENLIVDTYDQSTADLNASDLARAKQEDTPENLGYRLKAAKVLKDYVSQEEAEILEKKLQGQDIEGFDLRYVRGKTTVSDVLKAYQLVSDKIPVEEFIKNCTISISSLEAMLLANAEGDKKTLKRELISSLLKEGALTQGTESAYLYELNKTK